MKLSAWKETTPIVPEEWEILDHEGTYRPQKNSSMHQKSFLCTHTSVHWQYHFQSPLYQLIWAAKTVYKNKQKRHLNRHKIQLCLMVDFFFYLEHSPFTGMNFPILQDSQCLSKNSNLTLLHRNHRLSGNSSYIYHNNTHLTISKSGTIKKK